MTIELATKFYYSPNQNNVTREGRDRTADYNKIENDTVF